jgi:hypothetical protein
MKIAVLFLVLIPAAFAQARQSVAPSMPDQQKHRMDSMRADVQKLNASLNSIRASIPRINDLDERNRWQQTIDMWQVLINHMQQMSGGIAGEHEHHDADHPGEHHDAAPDTPPHSHLR